MGTKALIGYLDTNDLKLTSTYNHFDGYPANLGKGLETFYNSDDKAREIANVGYISFLDGETGEWDAKNKQAPKKTYLPNNFDDAMMSIAEQADNMGADYAYIWDNSDQRWVSVKSNSIRQSYGNLVDELSHLIDQWGGGTEQPTMEGEDEITEGKDDMLADWISDMLKYKSYDEVLRILKNHLDDAMEERSVGNKLDSFKAAMDNDELDEIFVRQMKYKAGIIK